LILNDIRNNAKLVNEDEDGFIRQLYNLGWDDNKAEIEKLEKLVRKIENRLSEISTFKPKLIEKNLNGILSDGDLQESLLKFNDEKADLENELMGTQERLTELSSQTVDIEGEVSKIKQCLNLQTLDRETITGLIHSIYVSEPVMVNDEKVINIEIRYRFQNPITQKKIHSLIS